jgi:hypothetical protein
MSGVVCGTLLLRPVPPRILFLVRSAVVAENIAYDLPYWIAGLDPPMRQSFEHYVA